MPLPATEDTRGDEDYTILQEGPNNHIPWTNDTGADVAKGDIVILGPLVCLADQDIASLAAGTLEIQDGSLVGTAQIAAGSTFAVIGAEVWYNPATGEVQDTSANNLYGIGVVGVVLNAAGVMYFLKRRYWVREAFYAET